MLVQEQRFLEILQCLPTTWRQASRSQLVFRSGKTSRLGPMWSVAFLLAGTRRHPRANLRIRADKGEFLNGTVLKRTEECCKLDRLILAWSLLARGPGNLQRPRPPHSSLPGPGPSNALIVVHAQDGALLVPS